MIRKLRKWDTSLILFTPLLGLLWLTLVVWFVSPDLLAQTRYLKLRWLPPFLDVILGGLLIIISAFATNKVVQNSVLLGRISNFPMLFILVLAAFLPMYGLGLDGGLMLLIQVPLLRSLLDLPEGERSGPLAFNSGAIIGLMTLLEPWSILLMLLAIQAMLSTGLLDLKKLLIHCIGVLTPFYLVNAFLFLLNDSFTFPAFSSDLSWSTESLLNGRILLQFILILVLAIFAFFSVVQITKNSTLREKRKWYLILSYLAISVFVVMLVGFVRGIHFMLVPGAIVLSRLFLQGSNQRALNLAVLVLLTLLVVLFFLGS